MTPNRLSQRESELSAQLADINIDVAKLDRGLLNASDVELDSITEKRARLESRQTSVIRALGLIRAAQRKANEAEGLA